MALIACAECQKQVSDKAVACPHCGAPVEAPEIPGRYACPSCGVEVEKGAHECAKCGAIYSEDGWGPERRAVKLKPAKACVHQEDSRKSSLWKWVLGVPVGALAIVMIVGSCAGNTPDGKARSNDRAAIDVCWEEQGRRSLDPSTGRFVAATCENMERDFQKRWGVKP